MVSTQAPYAHLPDTAQQFLDQLLKLRHLSAHTQRRYAQALGVLHETHPDLQAVTQQHLQILLSRQHMRGLTGRSLAVMASAWRSYCQWAVLQGTLNCNPSEDLMTPKVVKPLPKAMAVDRLGGYLNPPAQRTPAKRTDNHRASAKPIDAHRAKRIISSAEPATHEQSLHSSPHNPSNNSPHSTVQQALELRDQAMLELLYGCGLRVSELLGLDCKKSSHSLGWLDFAAPAVRVLGKGGNPRLVPLPSIALHAVQRWLAHRSVLLTAADVSLDDQRALFLGVRGGRMNGTELRRLTQRRALAAQVGQGVHPHMLRHSYASHLLQSSGDLRGVQELLGHRSIQATQIYTRLDFQHLSQVYDKAHPRSGQQPEPACPLTLHVSQSTPVTVETSSTNPPAVGTEP
jgi:integrase/recombinase XerC